MDDPSEPSDNEPGMTVVVAPRRARAAKSTERRVPRYHVILWDSEDHTFEYVQQMLRELFGHSSQECVKLAKQVDAEGRAVVLTTTLEHAELKRDQIHAFGKDEERGTAGSMSASIEAE
ncbi:ATP-dependent Clp protease adaptor ClpS [Botrimarina hoheduenensis]|uniref:ATP-dependent Clp protease adaptor n=1 Tax=Botrimarina hoheduenensis TaxID=2528000 RepID=A0A5C5W9K8_9BACT|nr:ATP-dependent Clp protease adaptor ClpS [Botrimarina hoheduenensis]TWT47304.1 ATP-dependent Clp protease adaptor [Botrimarina hoheduenensis]